MREACFCRSIYRGSQRNSQWLVKHSRSCRRIAPGSFTCCRSNNLAPHLTVAQALSVARARRQDGAVVVERRDKTQEIAENKHHDDTLDRHRCASARRRQRAVHALALRQENEGTEKVRIE